VSAARRAEASEPRPLAFAAAVGGGPVLWAIHLAGGAALVAPACHHHLTWALNALTIVTALGCAGVLTIALAMARAAGEDGRARFMGEVAALTSAASLALVLLEGAPVLVLDACAR
jgi:hypothetical protein